MDFLRVFGCLLVTLLASLSLFLAIFCLESPAAVWCKVCSFVPFAAPFVMMDLLLHGVGDWEIMVLLFALYAVFVFTLYLVFKVYDKGVVRRSLHKRFKN